MKEYQSKFRKNRAERDGAESKAEPKEPSAPKSEGAKPEREPGPRAQANEMNARPSEGENEQLTEQIGAGVEGMAPQAREVHITHDHASGRHHVHVVNEDGSESHSDHSTPEEAHMAGAAAGGVNPDGQYPTKHKAPMGEMNPDSTGDDFEPNIE